MWAESVLGESCPKGQGGGHGEDQTEMSKTGGTVF